MGEQTKDTTTLDLKENSGFENKKFVREFKSLPLQYLVNYLGFKFKPSGLTLKLLELLKDKGPLTSTEIQKEFEDKEKGFVRSKLSLLYRHGHLVRSPFMTREGFIYALPFDKDKIVDKLKQVVPGYVRNSLELVMTHNKMFSLNQLVEKTDGDYETLEYYLTKVFSKELGWIEDGFVSGYKVYWKKGLDKVLLEKDFVENIKKRQGLIKKQGVEFEREVKELFESYLSRLGLKFEKTSTGTPTGKYFDLSYNLYLFKSKPLQLKVEIKSYVPNLYQVACFYRKVREFKFGYVLPVLIAPGFPTNVYQTFGDVVYLLTVRDLKKSVKIESV